MIVMVIAVVCVGVGLILAFSAGMGALHRRLDALGEQRTHDDESAAAVARLHETATTKLALLMAGIQGYHDGLSKSLRGQLADAEVRERIQARRDVDSTLTIETASTLVRDLRTILDRLSDEIQRARERPLVREPRRPPPALAPPGGAEPMPPEPANIAAGLGPRPVSTARPPALGNGAPRKTTLLGIRPPAQPTANEGERYSEEELTQVVDRPKELPRGTDKTLPSMAAVAPSSKKVGAS